MSPATVARPGDPASSADTEAVTQLVLRERQTRDRGWYDDMADCFSPNAWIAMSWFTGTAAEFIATTKARTVHGVWGRHRLSPPTVRVHGNRAWAELPLGIEFTIDIDGVPADLVSYCRSQYRAERIGERWRISAITSIYERDMLTPSMPNQPLPIGSGALTGFRPSYRHLAWYFASQGTPLPDDLLGDDRPAQVSNQYRREMLWLDGSE